MGPCEDHVRLALEFQALLFSVVHEQLARASNAMRGLGRFLLCLLPADRLKQFLKERYNPAVVDDVIVRTPLREYRQHTWKNDLELATAGPLLARPNLAAAASESPLGACTWNA